MDLNSLRFTADPVSGGSVDIIPTSGNTLTIDSNFTGVSTTINSHLLPGSRLH